MGDFNETRLNDTVRYGFEGGPRFYTRVRRLANAAERRQRKWNFALWEYKAPYNRLTPEIYDEIYQAFLSQGGMADGFRFKDWKDYFAVGQFIGVAGADSAAISLVKSYVFGSAGYTRIIKKPVEDTVTVYQDAGGGPVIVAGTVDTTTGIFTPDDPWTEGAEITADFEFDVPVRFDTDYLPWNFEDFKKLSAEIPLVELRNP